MAAQQPHLAGLHTSGMPGTGRSQSYSTPEQDGIRRAVDLVRDDERDKIVAFLECELDNALGHVGCLSDMRRAIKAVRKGKYRR